eukprot:COSAG01_NODE_21745_length_886_cov_1.040609_1_plen_123_part_10
MLVTPLRTEAPGSLRLRVAYVTPILVTPLAVDAQSERSFDAASQLRLARGHVVLGALCAPDTAAAPPSSSSRKAKKRRGGGSAGAAAAPPAAPVEFGGDSQSCSVAAVRAALLGLLCDALRPA